MDLLWQGALCFFVAYLIGNINTAYFLGKRKGMDIRENGSGNPGASNAMVTMGWGAGVLTGAADIAKAALSVWIVRLIFPSVPLLWFLTAAGCIFGHLFPVFLGFRGGKGLACLIGSLIVIDWRAFLIGGAIIILVTLITDYIAIATIVLAVGFPILAYLIDKGSPTTLFSVLVASAVTLAILIKHIENIRNIISGKEIGLRKAHSGKYRKK